MGIAEIPIYSSDIHGFGARRLCFCNSAKASMTAFWWISGKRPVWPPYGAVFHGSRSSTRLIL